MIRQEHQIGCRCCGCHCLRYQNGNFQLDPHVQFAGNMFGVRIGCTRQADERIWKGYAGDTPGPGRSILAGVRVPATGKPRLLLTFDQPNALAWGDFDALAGRTGALFECANYWQLLEGKGFSYLGESVDASQAQVDGVAAVIPLTVPSSFVAPPDNVWCHSSYIPETIQVEFDHWQDQNLGAPGELRRASFNHRPMSIPQTGVITLGMRRIYNYGDSFGPAFYSDAAITCAGNIAWPKDTLRWRLRAQVNTPLSPDGTVTQIWVVIVEDQANAADAHGCHTTFSADLAAPRYTGFFKYLSCFDRVDDLPAITHWIKKSDTSANNSIPDGVTYWTSTFNFSPSAPPPGDLLRVMP